MYQNLLTFLRAVTVSLVLSLPSLLMAQGIVSRDFSIKNGEVSYTGKIRCMDSKVIIRSTLKVTPPKGAALDRYAEEVSLATMESFNLPAGLEQSVFWEAMLAKQFLTVGQAYFQTGTRYCAVNSRAHTSMLDKAQHYFIKAKQIFSSGGNLEAADQVNELLALLEMIRTNTDRDAAQRQFDRYYRLTNGLMKACICLGENYDAQYKCVTLN